MSRLMGDRSRSPAQLTGRERESAVQRMFSSIATAYDLNNAILSLGLHHRWKRLACRIAAEADPRRVLDVGAGTCDLALLLASQSAERRQVLAVDLNAGMLAVGREKLRKSQCGDRVLCCRGNAEALSFRDNTFDVAMAGFCIRNVGHLDRVLHEVHRVLRPGGRFICLEFSRPTAWALRKLYDLYSLWVVPRVGTWISGDRTEVYRYLPSSIRAFPDQSGLATLMRTVGFQQVDYRNVSGGIVAIHRAVK